MMENAMSKASTCKGQTKDFWTEEEDTQLKKIIGDKKKVDWGVAANKLHKRVGSNKTRKQCRQRYRNYLNPSLKNEAWTVEEKLLFVYLHNIFKNKWKMITNFLRSRSDISLKNCFYRTARKAIRSLRKKRVPDSYFDKKQPKFYMIYTTLDLLRKEYLPALKSQEKLPKNDHKEKIILKLLKGKNHSNQAISQFQKEILEKFKKFHKEAVVLKVDLEKFGIPKDKCEELIKMSKENEGCAALKGKIIIDFTSGAENLQEEEKKVSSPTALAPIQASPPALSPAISQAISPAAYHSPYNYAPCMYHPQLQINVNLQYPYIPMFSQYRPFPAPPSFIQGKGEMKNPHKRQKFN